MKNTTRTAMDLTNQPFERWTVIRFSRSDSKRRWWICRCQCGTEREVLQDRLTSGKSRSCGCLHKEIVAQVHTKHGLSPAGHQTPEYYAHQHILGRCQRPSHKQYPDYGGRGIKACARWQNVTAFVEDMGLRPTPAHSIDRINNDGHYSCGKCDECLQNGWPMNCRWATRKEQNNNTRANRIITYNGVSKTIAEWSEATGIHYEALIARLNRGWPVERAIETPVNGYQIIRA